MRRPRSDAETRRDIAIGPQQIGGAGLGVITLGGKPLRVRKAVLAADADRADAFRRIGRCAIAKLQQGEPRSLPDEGFGQERGTAVTRRDRRIQHRRARPRAAAPRIAIGGRQRRLIDRWHRQPPAIHHALAEFGFLGERQHCLAQPRLLVRIGRHEIGRAGGFADVLVSRRTALGVVALEQRLGRRSPQHAIELPRQILGILEPGIGAAGAERRDLMRGIAGKDHAAMDEPVHPAALELVQRDPFEIELVMAEHARDARPHILRQLFHRGIGKAIELQIDPPDVVRLLVQQRGASGMEWRIEPEPALGRKRRRHLDVGDQELILEHLPCKFRTHHLPQRRAGAVAGDDELRIQPIRAIRRLDRQQHMVVARLKPRHLVAPAQVDRQGVLRRDRPDRPRHRIAAG